MIVTDPNQINEFYHALLERKPSFVGSFFVGVKTTSVFCISICRARKPKIENVIFFTTFKEALDHGFRPCKVCQPTGNANEAPEQVKKSIRLVKDNPKIKITDQILRENDISPEAVRRWFNKNYGMTFQSYQRMYRINHAYQELKSGKATSATAYGSGYESLSGFSYTFKKALGISPTDSSKGEVILIDRLTTPIGPMFVCATSRGICLLEFVDRKMLETEFKDIQRLLASPIISGENEHIRQLKSELKEYFDGSRRLFEVSIDAPGSEFQQTTWQALNQIDYGKTATYQDQAIRIGNPNAVRAVASANGANRISIVIPCHRVIGKDGKLTGYGGGLPRKRWLLDHEKKHSGHSSQQPLLADAVGV